MKQRDDHDAPVTNPFYSPELAEAVANLKTAVLETREAKALERFMLWLSRKLERG